VDQHLTIRELVGHLAPELWKDAPPRWPPDSFAVAASVLQKSGAYIFVASNWPPPPYNNGPIGTARWAKDIANIGREWRQSWVDGGPLPDSVSRWWKVIRDHGDRYIYEVRGRDLPDLWEALMQLSAAADEASVGVGIPTSQKDDPFQYKAKSLLAPLSKIGSTLCERIASSRLRVLPKLHTPQSGITIRSLTHNLALCQSADVEALWYTVPNKLAEPEIHGLNLLLIPWPLVVGVPQFQVATPLTGPLPDMPPRYGFFNYIPPDQPANFAERVMEVFDKAKKRVQKIDGVIFPELALTVPQREAIRQKITEREAFLVCGNCEFDPSGAKLGKNYLTMYIPTPSNLTELPSEVIQYKHHRWLLDKDQLLQYRITSKLDIRKLWWEHATIEHRSLAFVPLQPWLTLCALICEDLARQDPVGELIRAVGPNLVIALLMDGPQLTNRWSARYAAVLADDPGSSVLSLTSLGMAELSKPEDKPASRVVALWKDAKSARPREIELPPGCDAVVLTLTLTDQPCEEFTADGRSDGGSAGYPVYGGHIAI
jgi:hypothetical protein